MKVNGINKKLADTLKLTPTFWKKLGSYIAKWVREDFKNGVFQNDMQKLPYLSRQYTDYKSRRMALKTQPGKRLRSYYAQSIQSNQTSYVDMTLTGKLKDSLRPVKSDSRSVTMSYSPADKNPEKIAGNRIYGREVVGLNDKNRDKVFDRILKEIDENLLSWAREEIKINIGWK